MQCNRSWKTQRINESCTAGTLNWDTIEILFIGIFWLVLPLKLLYYFFVATEQKGPRNTSRARIVQKYWSGESLVHFYCSLKQFCLLSYFSEIHYIPTKMVSGHVIDIAVTALKSLANRCKYIRSNWGKTDVMWHPQKVKPLFWWLIYSGLWLNSGYGVEYILCPVKFPQIDETFAFK